jgi:N utilization substance protein A
VGAVRPTFVFVLRFIGSTDFAGAEFSEGLIFTQVGSARLFWGVERSMKSEFQAAINQVATDRNLPKEVIVDAIRAALVSAYKRDFGSHVNLVATLDPNTGVAHILAEKQVVEVVEDEQAQIALSDAQALDGEAMLGSIVRVDITPKNFGRIAAQTAKQVILQRIREAKRDHLYSNYSEREGELLVGTVQYIGANGVTLALGDEAEAVLPKEEQIPNESYRREQRLRVYIFKVEKSSRGPQIFVSRTHKKLLLRLLELEVPEIANGIVEVRAIAREPGGRSKVAVNARQPGIDPVGSCVGMRGGRIQHIVDELNGEKIDIVPWSPDMATFIANALSPAKVVSVSLGEGKTATVIVPDKQLSLAIGKEGQNARLAAKLTGWRIDIVNQTDATERALKHAAEATSRAEEEKRRQLEEEQLRTEAAALLAEAEASLLMDESAESVGVETTESHAEAITPETTTTEVMSPAPSEAVAETLAVESAANESVADPATGAPGDVAFTEDVIEAVMEPVVREEDDEAEPAVMKGKKKAKKGKREIALEQRQAAAKKKKTPALRRVEEGETAEMDWQHLRNVKAESILAEDELSIEEANETDRAETLEGGDVAVAARV